MQLTHYSGTFLLALGSCSLVLSTVRSPLIICLSLSPNIAAASSLRPTHTHAHTYSADHFNFFWQGKVTEKVLAEVLEARTVEELYDKRAALLHVFGPRSKKAEFLFAVSLAVDAYDERAAAAAWVGMDGRDQAKSKTKGKIEAKARDIKGRVDGHGIYDVPLGSLEECSVRGSDALGTSSSLMGGGGYFGIGFEDADGGIKDTRRDVSNGTEDYIIDNIDDDAMPI